MPITSLSLTTRTGKGSALNVTEHDANLTAIQTAVNALITQVAAQHNDDGSLKAGAVAETADIANAIVTLAKMAALDASDKGKWIRANPSTGAVEAAELYTGSDIDNTQVNSSGSTAGTTLTTFSFADVPAGDVLVWGICHILRNSGSNGGTVWLEDGSGTAIGETNTHCVDAGTTQWMQLMIIGRLADFAGGTLSLLMKFETSEASSNVTFGASGDDRFGRKVMLLAGLSTPVSG